MSIDEVIYNYLIRPESKSSNIIKEFLEIQLAELRVMMRKFII